MPTYNYECQKCDHKFEEFRQIKDRRNGVVCHECGSEAVELIPAAVDHILKGVGWARDGYRNKVKKED